MKTRMTPLSTAMLAASLMLAASAPASAAPPSSANGPGSEMHGERGADHHPDRMAPGQTDHWEQRLAELKASLKLTPSQTSAWETFQAAVKPPAREARANREGSPREDWAKLKTPERLDRMRTLRQERDAAATRREEATKTFYASLSAEQQKTFDERTRRPLFGEEPGGPGPGPRPR
ncbi:Spy/CpxP family protein refolding chaperone [Hylemonella sp. W303a]|uniref:Spy/CpxP family protein refolding chaperone n=1 Tax=Hylemonella sp. W303a TaxID=3389873 RepID=UPI00396B2EFA